MLTRLINFLSLNWPRVKLYGHSLNQLKAFRADCINVCQPTGQPIPLRLHGSKLQQVLFFPGINTRFEYLNFKFNLKFPKDKGLPCWDMSKLETTGTWTVTTIPFNHPNATVVTKLVSSMIRYFPFPPNDDALINGGKPIA